jgi:DNA polymerase-1
MLNRQSTEIALRLHELEQQAYVLAEQSFNLNSPKQLGEIFFQKLGLPVVKKPSGAPSTDEEVLQKLAEDYPLPKLVLEYRGLAKLKSTYTDKLPKMIHPETGRVHTNYAQAVAVTGRLASNDPNLQNIPVRTAEGRRIREAFIAAPGHHMCRRITRRLNCASWRIFPATRICSKPLPMGKISTAPPLLKFSV